MHFIGLWSIFFVLNPGKQKTYISPQRPVPFAEYAKRCLESFQQGTTEVYLSKNFGAHKL